jgi:hypothetical protein
MFLKNSDRNQNVPMLYTQKQRSFAMVTDFHTPWLASLLKWVLMNGSVINIFLCL